jgi:hypothetical protein
MKTMLAALAALSTVGCVPTMLTTTSESFHTLAQASYDTSEKRQVWGRALEQFQRHNAIVTVVDYEAGVLASGGQPAGPIPCNAYAKTCELTVGWQFTISDDGTSLLSVRRGITGQVEYISGPLLRDDGKEMLDLEADVILADIVGERGSVAQRPKRTPAAAALLPVGAKCSAHSECKSGQCSMLKCSR